MEADLEAGGGGMRAAETRDLVSALRSEGNWLLNSENEKGSLDQSDFDGSAGTSQASKTSTLSDGFQPAMKRCSSLPPVGTAVDLHSDHGSSCRPQDMVSVAKPALDVEAKIEIGRESKTRATPVLGLDLNVVDPSHTTDYNPFQPYKKLDQLRPMDPSECGSTTGPIEENVSLKKWKAMKENGFLSLNHGGIPLPKERGRQPRKRKEDAIKKRMEIARREQAKKVANVVGPSGLLSGLNPGIINHVRNKKQVLSIIAATVKSETLERKRNDKLNGRDEGTYDSASSKQLLPQVKKEFFQSQCGTSGTMKDNGMLFRDDKSSSFFTTEQSDDVTLKPSSMGCLASESASQTSDGDDLARKQNIAFLSVKGANVASQWLELLRQDIKGRLAALRRSRKRVRNAIQTELPILLSKGNVNNQDDSTHLMQFSGVDATPEMHLNRWKILFSRMEKELSEEGKHLEAWLDKVTEMLTHCDMSLSSVNLDFITSVGSSDNTRFKRAATFDAESAVRAAAASIYSTCTLAMSKENVPCY